MYEDALPLQPLPHLAPNYFKDNAATVSPEIVSEALQNSSTTRLRHQLSSEQWDDLKPLIQRLYIEKRWTYIQIADFLAKGHRFRPTRKQFMSRVVVWNFKKYAKKKERFGVPQNLRLANQDPAEGIAGNKLKKQKLEHCCNEMKENNSQFFGRISQSTIKGDSEWEQCFEPSSPSPAAARTSFLTTDTDFDIAPSVEVEEELDVCDCGQSLLRLWTSVDILGSPKLTCLFDTLKSETSGLPEDIESLVLPTSVIESRARSEERFVNASELAILYSSDNGSSCSWNDAAPRLPEIEHSLAGLSNRPRSMVTSPFIFYNTDAWFPSGAHMESDPSPFNEIDPFPAYYGSQREQCSRPLVQSYQIQEEESRNMLARLTGSGFHDSTPMILEVTRRLAQAYYDQGKQRQAELLYRKLISAQQRRGDAPSANILSVQIDLVNTMCEQGRLLEAKNLQEEVHSAIIDTFASRHSLVRRSLLSIGRIWGLLKNHEEEEDVCRQLVQMNLIHLGPRDPKTLDSIYRLALALRGRRKFAESEGLQRVAIQLYQETHQQRHDDICWSLEALARVFKDQDRSEEAIALFRLSAERAKEFLGVEHISTMNCQRVLGRELRKLELYEESEELLKATVQVQIDVMGEDYPYTLWSIYELGETLRKREKYQESSIWLGKTFRKSLTIFGPSSDLAIESCDSLGICYESRGLYREAKVLYSELLDKIRAAQGDNEQSIEKVQGWIRDIVEEIEGEWAVDGSL